PEAVTVCDMSGRIIAMNKRSIEAFAADGGAKLIGTNVLDCHPEPSRTMLKKIMDENRTNVYTIQKNGKKKLIYQAPWYEDGVYGGFIELSLEIPLDLPHFNRD
ncbi:MAG: diguanylate cyclase, partial [Candidatus Aminicenantes bacterium]|nr:diguanylate cyclase [Candidatus Aminicenantes bacterium]